ncbi:MAG: hypothetical protein WD425_20780, partial [Nitrospirales bacterium]
MGRTIAERLSGSVIQQVSRFLQFDLGYPSKVLVFWEPLPDQPVRIFVHSSFPRSIRMCKVNLGIEILSH